MFDASSEELIITVKQYLADVHALNIPEEIAYIRTDAGTQFMSEEFQDFCRENKFKLTHAASKHQEMNAYSESTWCHISTMARSMMVHADLSLHFWYEARRYAVEILNILPSKGLLDKNGNPTTPHFMVHKSKPRIGKFHVFGCPCTFKRYQPKYQTRTVTKIQQTQRGSRGVFVGFAPHQAGYLIYTEQPIKNSHIITSQDVTFDDDFITSTTCTNKVFHAGRLVRDIGQGNIPSLENEDIEQTGSIDTVNSEYIQDPKGLSEEGLDSGNVSDEEISIAIQPRSLRRSPRIQDLYLVEENPEPSITTEEILMEINEPFNKAKNGQIVNAEPVDIYLPEPKSSRSMLKQPKSIRNSWLKAIKLEYMNLINNNTFNLKENPLEGDQIIPTSMIYKAT
jgi:hypothetical protein